MSPSSQAILRKCWWLRILSGIWRILCRFLMWPDSQNSEKMHILLFLVKSLKITRMEGALVKTAVIGACLDCPTYGTRLCTLFCDLGAEDALWLLWTPSYLRVWSFKPSGLYRLKWPTSGQQLMGRDNESEKMHKFFIGTFSQWSADLYELTFSVWFVWKFKFFQHFQQIKFIKAGVSCLRMWGKILAFKEHIVACETWCFCQGLLMALVSFPNGQFTVSNFNLISLACTPNLRCLPEIFAWQKASICWCCYVWCWNACHQSSSTFIVTEDITNRIVVLVSMGLQ